MIKCAVPIPSHDVYVRTSAVRYGYVGMLIAIEVPDGQRPNHGSTRVVVHRRLECAISVTQIYGTGRHTETGCSCYDKIHFVIAVDVPDCERSHAVCRQVVHRCLERPVAIPEQDVETVVPRDCDVRLAIAVEVCGNNASTPLIC